MHDQLQNPSGIAQRYIAPVSDQMTAALQHKLDHKTKPLGALGRLESLALQIGRVQSTLNPVLNRPVALVFAGDHGIVEAGISPYPQAVTQQMVLNFLNGGAAINVLARQHGLLLRVVDAGVNHTFGEHPQLLDRKIAMGTQNFLQQPAMTEVQCQQALEAGAQLAADEIAQGSNLLVFGEMGIGNTTAAAALMAAICRLPAAACAGAGTGLDAHGVNKKAKVIEQALQQHHGHLERPLDILARLGGFEIAMMAGCMLGAANGKALLLIDGFIATAAVLVAVQLQPAIRDYCIFAHCSGEHGHRAMLDFLQAEPLLDLHMRLGEGTGAVLAYPILQSAVALLNEMASFEEAGVSERNAS